MQDYFGTPIAFPDFCGLKPVHAEPGKVILSLDLQPHHANQLGIPHGGVLLTLLDTALGCSARVTTGHTVMTVDIQTAFIAPGKGKLTAEGRVVRAGRSLVFTEGEVRDASGQIIAKATAVMKTIRKSEGTPPEKP